MIRKYAALDVLDAQIAVAGRPMQRTSHRVAFEYTPRPGYLYVRSRMISSRCNDNYDEFPADEIEKGWHTFIGKPVFVNHHNADHRKARGVIIDAALHKDANPDGSPDTWVEGLMEVDAMSYPKLAKALVLGHIERTSMGVDVDYSICSKCANKAASPLEYCQHIPTMKGMKAAVKTASGTVRNEIIREKCYGLRFFENSLLVEDPADPTAYFLGKVEAGPGLEHLSMNRTAKAKQFSPDHFDSDSKSNSSGKTCSRWNCTNPAVATHELGGKTLNVCKTHKNEMDSSKESALATMKTGVRCLACYSTDTLTVHGSTECTDCGNVQDQFSLPHNPHSARFFQHLARIEADNPQEPLVPHKPVKQMTADEKKEWGEQVKGHAKEWHARNPISADNIVDHWHAGTDHEHAAGMTWYSDAHETAKHIANDTGHDVHKVADLISNYSPQTHWATNITTSARVAREGKPLGGKDNKDGIPNTDKKGNPVPIGIMASEDQKNKAQRILDGEHRDTVFSGPKTHAFAHLIGHGGNSPEDQAAGRQRVCVDRHALSVACGARASDAAYGHSGLAGKKRYNEAETAYTEAARRISDHVGYKVEGHQVQAATWLTRQRLNEEGDRETVGGGSRSAGAAKHAIAKMQQYMGEHHPAASLQLPGTGYSADNKPNNLERLDNDQPMGNPSHEPQPSRTSARRATPGSRLPFVRPSAPGLSRVGYGEVKAPPDVDTLRDEECPICGEQDAYDGTECKVCGYVEPPKQFQDPDVGMAKSLDLRKDNADPAQMNGQDVGHLEDALADPDRDGFDDETGEPIEGGAVGGDGPMLACPACDSQFEPAAPETVTTSPDEEMAGEEQALGADPGEAAEAAEGIEPPREGDVCPVCGKGVLMGAQGAEALAEEGPPPADEEGLPDGAAGPDEGPEATGDPRELPDDEAPDEEATPSEEEEAPFGNDEEEADENDRSLPSDNDEEAEDPAEEIDQDSSDEPVKKSRNPFKR